MPLCILENRKTYSFIKLYIEISKAFIYKQYTSDKLQRKTCYMNVNTCKHRNSSTPNTY